MVSINGWAPLAHVFVLSMLFLTLCVLHVLLEQIEEAGIFGGTLGYMSLELVGNIRAYSGLSGLYEGLWTSAWLLAPLGVSYLMARTGHGYPYIFFGEPSSDG